MGKEIRNGQVLCKVSKPIQTMRWRPSSPATINGVVGDSKTERPQVGNGTESDSATWTLSKFTKRKSGWAVFQSTSGGPSTLPICVNQFVAATLMARTFASGQTAGMTLSRTTKSKFLAG